jgi:hypothetical protein
MKTVKTLVLLVSLVVVTGCAPPPGGAMPPAPPAPAPSQPQAPAAPAEELVESLTVEIWTGGDDLRGGSQAFAFVKFAKPSDPPIEHNLNSGVGWGGDTLQRVSFQISPRPLSELTGFGIRFASSGDDWNADNWNMDSVKVTYNMRSRSGLLLERKGRPFWRFQKNALQTWETELATQIPSTDTPITTLTAEVITGEDDLRSDSSAVLFVKLDIGGDEKLTLTSTDFNGGSGRGSGDTTAVNLKLPFSTVWGHIKGIGIKFNSPSSDLTADNWNINQVKLILRNASGSSTVFIAQGHPVWRFQKNANQIWEAPINFK